MNKRVLVGIGLLIMDIVLILYIAASLAMYARGSVSPIAATPKSLAALMYVAMLIAIRKVLGERILMVEIVMLILLSATALLYLHVLATTILYSGKAIGALVKMYGITPVIVYASAFIPLVVYMGKDLWVVLNGLREDKVREPSPNNH